MKIEIDTYSGEIKIDGVKCLNKKLIVSSENILSEYYSKSISDDSLNSSGQITIGHSFELELEAIKYIKP